MALTLEELYARRAQQRQANRGLLNSPMGARRRMGGMGGSAMRTIPDMAQTQTVVPSDLPDMEIGDGAMPRETYRRMMEGRSGGRGPARRQPPPINMSGPGPDAEPQEIADQLAPNPEVVSMMQGGAITPSQVQEAIASGAVTPPPAQNRGLLAPKAPLTDGAEYDALSDLELAELERDVEPDATPVAPPPTGAALFNNLANTVTAVTDPAQTVTVTDAAPAQPVTVTDAAPAQTVTTAPSETAFNNLSNTVADTTSVAAQTADQQGDAAVTPATNAPAAAEDTSAAGVTNAALMSQVNGMYNKFLGRNGNPDNMQYWVNQLAAGVPLADVERAIANSPEGIAYATRQTQETVGDGSGEENPVVNQTNDELLATINGLYNQYLGRDGNLSYMQNWADQLAAGRPLAEVAADIANSPEGQRYAERQQQTIQQVTQAYRDLLGRDPLDEGLNYWVGTINNGATLDEVIYNIRQSPEFSGRATNIIQQAFAQYLERGATEAELSNYLQQAKGGVPLPQIEAEIQALAGQDDSGGDGGLPTAPVPDPTPTGSQQDVQAARDDTETYEAETAADSEAAQAISTVVPTRTVQPEETAQYQLNQILDPNSPLMQRARTQGMQFANQRGLLNSSLAAQAAQTAMLDAAVPIAQQDARTFAEAAGQITDIEGRAGLQDAALGTDVSKFNVSETNVTNRFNAESLNQAGAFNANAANTSIQNFLQREAARLLQDDQQLFTAQQNQADRELRNYLQERQFDFQGSENALDRDLQEKLQQNDQVFRASESQLDRDFRSGEAQLDRDFQSTERALDRDLQTSEAALDRTLSQLLSNDRIAFETWSQENAQVWNATQNQLQRDFDRYRVDAQTASTVMFSTMESIAQIYADPNLNAAQKQAAIQNVMDLATSTPALVSQITAGMNRDTQNELPEGVDATAYTDPEALLGDAFDPEANYWIGPFGSQYGAAHHPTWIIPPEAGTEVSQGIELLTNPETGQIYIAPTGGYRLRGADDDFTDTGGGDGDSGPNIPDGFTAIINPQTGRPIPNLYTGPDGGSYRYDPATGQMVPFSTNPYGP